MKKVIGIVIGVVVVSYLLFLLIQKSPVTRDFFCKSSGGEVIYPMGNWVCTYDSADPRKQLN